MKAVFKELPPFSQVRKDYFGDDAFLKLQSVLLTKADAGAVIEGTGGLRKLQHGDPRCCKGSRGGLRIIDYWWLGGD